MATALANTVTITPTTLDRLIAAMSPQALTEMRTFAWQAFLRSEEEWT